MKIVLSNDDIWQLVHWQRFYKMSPVLSVGESGKSRVRFGEVEFPLGQAMKEAKKRHARKSK